jgi:hypothetical protein
MDNHIPYVAGRTFLELQLAFMKQAFSLAGQGTQRMLDISLAAKDKRRVSRGETAPDPGYATSAQLARARVDYVTRMQEDVDTILHAFAMAPVAAERAILESAQRKPPARDGAVKAHPARKAPRKKARAARGEHAA